MVRQSTSRRGTPKVRYNVMSVPFDARTRTFGAPRLEVDCRTMGKSGTLPRISPDGRYLLITLGDFGQFHIWHKSSDLWVKDLKTGAFYPLRAANSPEVDSYHTWSSNGRWIVFSSRRLDGNFTRPCIAYFDRNGQAHKAFLLPQEDPEERGELAEFCLPYDLWNPVISLLNEESTDVQTLRKLAFAQQNLLDKQG